MLVKVTKLAKLIKKSKHMVFYTGAGISTSANIPDFRGPNGIWTRKDAGLPPPKMDKALNQVEPTLTHMGMLALINKDLLKFITSQNVDGLHLKSGIPMEKLSELHGNCFIERCDKCHRTYFRSFSVSDINHDEIDTSAMSWGQLKHMTGRRCKTNSCLGILKDTIINFGENLPEDELSKASENASTCDLAVCWGSSLTVSPACNLPKQTLKLKGGKLVIINLQPTPLDQKCHLKIHAKTDRVMELLLGQLKIDAPTFGGDYYKQTIEISITPLEKTMKLLVQGKDIGRANGFFGIEKVEISSNSFDYKRVIRWEPLEFTMPLPTKSTTVNVSVFFYGITKPIEHTIQLELENLKAISEEVQVDFEKLAYEQPTPTKPDQPKKIIDDLNLQDNEEDDTHSDSVCNLQ
uniref:protein acetyllysine N-acetyltransferase n=1 Tax=Arcella intermedia TaxID=1963864 RepID=A0A6B2L5T5_9EUKA